LIRAKLLHLKKLKPQKLTVKQRKMIRRSLKKLKKKIQDMIMKILNYPKSRNK